MTVAGHRRVSRRLRPVPGTAARPPARTRRSGLLPCEVVRCRPRRVDPRAAASPARDLRQPASSVPAVSWTPTSGTLKGDPGGNPLPHRNPIDATAITLSPRLRPTGTLAGSDRRPKAGTLIHWSSTPQTDNRPNAETTPARASMSDSAWRNRQVRTGWARPSVPTHDNLRQGNPSATAARRR